MLYVNKKNESASVATAFIYVADSVAPVFGVRAFTKDSDTKQRFGAAVIFRGSFEYVEGGSTEGYDPADGDTVVQSTNISFVGRQQNLWSLLSVNQVPITGGDGDPDNRVITVRFGSQGVLLAKINISFTMDIVGQAAQFGDKIVTPNTAKISLVISNYNILPTSTGLVLDALLVTAKRVVDSGNNTGEENVKLQDFDTDQSGGIFNWDLESFTNFTGNGMTTVTTSKFTQDTTIDPSQFTDEIGTVQQVYFSWSDNTVSTFIWDPTIGFTDGSSIIYPSLLLSALVLLICQLLL